MASGVTRIPSVDVETIRKAAEELPERIIKLIVIFLMQRCAATAADLGDLRLGPGRRFRLARAAQGRGMAIIPGLPGTPCS